MADFVFNVARLLAQTSGARRTVDVDAPARVLDVPEVQGSVCGRALLTRLDVGVLVTGRMRAQVCVPCDRCTDDVRRELVFELDDQFVPRLALASGGVIDPGDRWQLDPGHNLDLSQVLAEGVISAIPPRLVCADGCELPDVRAPAQGPPLDPRLAQLERLRRKMFPDDAVSHG